MRPQRRPLIFLFVPGAFAGWPGMEPASAALPDEAGVHTAGDLDADGYDDVVVQGSGAVELYPGAREGVVAEGIRLPGNESCDVGDAGGDFDGDGVDDLLCADGGFLWLVTGQTSRAFAAGWTWEGTSSAASLAIAGDVDGDGLDDAVVGFPDEGSGSVRFFAGANGQGEPVELSAPADRTRWGFSVAGAGDPNGDGYRDVLATAPTVEDGGYAPELWLFLGSATGPDAADPLRLSDHAESRGGFTAAPAGDVDGDGWEDVALGEIGYYDGEIVVFAGGPTPGSTSWRVVGKGYPTGGLLGYHMDAAGDLDGDGYGDLVVGEPEYQYSSRQYDRVAFVFGSPAGPVLDVVNDIHGIDGHGLEGGVDVNADGIPDFVAGGLPGLYYGRQDRDDDRYPAGGETASDCDDTDDTVSPGGEEIAGDGIDQDCDGADLEAEVTPDDDTGPIVSDTGKASDATGCGCASGGRGAGALALGLPALMAWRRSRRERDVAVPPRDAVDV